MLWFVNVFCTYCVYFGSLLLLPISFAPSLSLLRYSALPGAEYGKTVEQKNNNATVDKMYFCAFYIGIPIGCDWCDRETAIGWVKSYAPCVPKLREASASGSAIDTAINCAVGWLRSGLQLE